MTLTAVQIIADVLFISVDLQPLSARPAGGRCKSLL